MNQRPAQQLRIKEEFEDDEQQLLRLRSCRRNISIKREFDAENEATISRSFVCIKEEPGNDGAPCDCEDCLEEEEQEHESPRQILEPNRRLVCIKVELGDDDQPCDCSDCSGDGVKGEVVSDAEEDTPLRTRRRRVKRELDSDSEPGDHYIVCIKKELNEDQQCDCTECQEEESIQNGESNSQPSTPSAFSGSDAEAMGPEETEDDDLAPMCLCRRPYQNRFSIECDCCQQWYHGDCVGVSPEQGQELEQSGQPWHCTLCTRMFIDGLEPEEIKRRVKERFANGSASRQNSSRKKKLSQTKRRKRRKIIVNLNSSSDEEGVEGHSSGSDWEEMAARQRIGQNRSRGSISAPVVQQTSSSDSEDSAESQLSSASSSDDLNSPQPMPSTSRRSTKSIRQPATPSSSKPFQCDDCELAFRFKKSLLVHQLVVHQATEGPSTLANECPTCSRTFISQTEFRQHLCRHTSTEASQLNHKCTQCPRAFSQRKSLKRHTDQVHGSPDRPYKCSQCDACYTAEHNLNIHRHFKHGIRVSGVHVYKCKPCRLEFPKRDHLERHQFNVHGVRKWICNTCGMINPSKEARRAHQETHKEGHRQRGQRIFQCPECPMAFPRKWDLSVHQRCKHPTAETEQLPCPICGRVFHFKKYLKQHIVGVHRRVGRKTADLMCVSKKHRRGDKVLFIESEESEIEASESDDDDQEEETPTGRRSSRGTTARRTTKRKG